jgi:uncharacterized protein (TIGR02147 family)
METASIYNYQNPRQFVLDRVNTAQRENSGVSIRQLALKMGISHTLLVMILQGKRSLRVKHAGAIAQGLGLSSQERLYLQALIQLDSAKDVEEKHLCQLLLTELHPEQPVKIRQIEQFELISNWIHMAILSACDLSDFDPAPEAIAKRFGTRVNANEIRAAMERLKGLGLIELLPDGGFRPTQKKVTTPDDVANAGARRYHKEVMDLAQEALDRVPISHREFQSCAISVPDNKVALAKEMVRKFRSQLAKAMGEGGDEVYQFNIQFFQLTESPRRSLRREDEGVDGKEINSKFIRKKHHATAHD